MESKVFAVVGAVILALAVLALAFGFLRKTKEYSERAEIADGSAGSKLVMACKAWLSGEVYSVEAVVNKYNLVDVLKPFATSDLKCSGTQLDQIINEFTKKTIECASGKDVVGVCKDLYFTPSWGTLSKVREFCLAVVDIHDRCCIEIKHLSSEEAPSCLVDVLDEMASRGGEVCSEQAC